MSLILPPGSDTVSDHHTQHFKTPHAHTYTHTHIHTNTLHALHATHTHIHTYTLIHFMHYMPHTLHTHHTHITLQQHHNSTHSYTHTAHCTPNNTQRAIIFLPICQFSDSLPILANLPIFTQQRILLATCNLHLPNPAFCFTSLNILQPQYSCRS